MNKIYDTELKQEKNDDLNDVMTKYIKFGVP